MVKVTFTLDDDTVRTLKSLSARTRKPQSLVVREAVAHYAVKEDKLTDEERDYKLRVLRELGSQLPTRPPAEVTRELSERRRSRRTGWTRPSDR